MATETTRQLRWLMILRVVVVTTLLISTFAIELLLMPAETLRPLFKLAAVAYGMVLVYAFLYWAFRHGRTLVALQLGGDALVVTGFVGITGGLDSPMSFLYLLPICVASMLLYSSGGLALAGISWGLYTALVTVGPGWVHSGRPIIEYAPNRVWYSLVVHLVGMVAVALLSAYLSERLRTQGDELAERKGAVARLRALNENIIESINSGLVTTDMFGKINFVNRGGSEILGLSRSDLEGRTMEDVFGLAQEHLHEIRRQLITQRRFRFERYFETNHRGRIFLGIAASNLHDRAGSPLGYLFIFQDLTDIQALEQEVRLKERMAALGEMAAGMAHELRNPLAAISGSVQFLKSDLRASDETLDLMDNILRESHRLDGAIRDFLMFARPGKFDPQRADLVKLLQNSIKLLEKSPEFGPAHRIESRYAAESVWCEVDSNRMKQVFWNLANNALKAMPEGGTLRIEVGETEEQLEISFTDDGRGMTEQEKKRYFQPFSGSFEEGTGLGAAIVYRLVEEHGGKIVVDSGPGDGTRVRMSIPRRRPVPRPEKTAASVAGPPEARIQ